MRPNPKNVKQGKPATETQYQKDYPPKKNPRKKWDKFNYDNLMVGHPDKFNNRTTYDHYHDRKNPYPNSKDIGELIKMANTMPHNQEPNDPLKNTTEYRRHYTPKKIHHSTCPINIMPDVSRRLLKDPHHIRYNKFNRKWY